MRFFTIAISGHTPMVEDFPQVPGCPMATHRMRERGVSLVVGLIFLVVLTILGLMALRGAILEERMSGNARERSLAFQAAEAALRDAELDIQCKRFDGAPSALRPGGCIEGATGRTRLVPTDFAAIFRARLRRANNASLSQYRVEPQCRTQCSIWRIYRSAGIDGSGKPTALSDRAIYPGF